MVTPDSTLWYSACMHGQAQNAPIHWHNQDFLWWGVHFLLDQKSDGLFLVITLSYMFIYVIYCHQLPFYLIFGGAPHQIQPHLCLIPTKMPRKHFLSPWGMHLHPLHLPGHAYASSSYHGITSRGINTSLGICMKLKVLEC